MGSEWRIVKLGDLLELLTDYHANGSYKILKQNVTLLDVPDYAIMIRTTNFEQNEFGTTLKYITEDAYNFLKKSKVFSGDIIMNKIANAGSCYYVHDFKQPVSLAMNLFLLRIDQSLANPKYVFSFLKANEAYVKNFAEGSVTKTITKAAVRNLEIILPPLPEQKAIAHILGSMDDKIELNRQMNATLEQMAQALFKSWFVDFDPVIDNAIVAGNGIPEELADRAEARRKALADGTANREAAGQFPDAFWLTEEMGWIPEGWEVKPIIDQVNLTMGQSPSSKYYNKDGIGLPFHQGVTNYGERFPKHEQFSTDGSRYAVQGDILFSVRAPVGRINISDRRIIIGRGLSALRHKRNYQGFLMYFLKYVFQKEDTIGSGTIFNAVTKKEMEHILYIVPTDVITKRFDNIAISLDEKIAKNAEQTQSLTNLRDTLLPKLISGELHIL